MLVAAVAIGLTVSAAFGGPARADGNSVEVSNASTEAVAPVFDPARGEQDEVSSKNGDVVAKYWTAERMARATPVETSEITTAAEREFQKLQPKEVGPERTVEASLPVTPVERPDAVVGVTNWSHVNGKVFFRNATDGSDYVCSASAVNSGSRSMVATAGHCVHGGPGQTWHQNWVFIPGYHNGVRPHGTFQARTFRTMSDWVDHGNTPRGLNSDVAFVATFANEFGRRVVDAVGGHGLITGGVEYEFYADWFAYPMNRSGGEVMWACWGNTAKGVYESYGFIGIAGCDFGGGASGGPYLKDYSNNSGLGKIKTVNSWSLQDDHSRSNGPFLRAAVWDMYVAADGD